MKLSRVSRILVVLVAISAAKLIAAQQPQQEWVPKGIEALRQSASSKTDFTLDHSMLAVSYTHLRHP